MRRRHLLVVLLLTVATPAWSQTGEWHDPSPHKATLVDVDDGVRLEVLDWGGTGRPLLLLAGLGDSAHVFDDIAPTLAARYRVVGVSRRGFPGSSSPMTGYTSARLAEDDVRVMDAMKLQRPVVVGHSYAGEEMHVLGARYADRIAGLIYVDAAFDRGDRFEPYETALRAMPPAPRPQPSDLTSFAALRAFLTRNFGPPGPEAHLRARYVGNPDGSVRGPWTPEPHVMQGYTAETRAMTKSYAPEPIRVAALAMYASPKSANELMRAWYAADDAALRQRVEALYPLERENVARHARWFAKFAERGRSVELSGGHYLFVTNSGEVLQQIDGFMTRR
jgi:pimeloyl-ACP methyl ester carboxylesterase